jgi:PilZ domain
VDPEARAENDEQPMSPDDGRTLPETSEPDRNSLAVMPLPPRAEWRIPKRMLVKLSDPEKSDFEITRTVDISGHGARVVSKRSWRPNLQLSVLSISGKLYSFARVAHCQSREDGSYAVGLELFRPSADWAEVNEDRLPLP